MKQVKHLCDFCNEDYSNSDKLGGFLFGSKAVCPKCAPRIRANAEKYNEEKYITKVCKPKQSFRSFVLAIRDGDNSIKFYS